MRRMSRRYCSYAHRPAVFTREECEQIRGLGEALDLKDAETDTDAAGSRVALAQRNCKLRFVKPNVDGWAWVFERMNEHAHAVNESTWKFGIKDLEAIQYTSYGMGHFYAAHFDNGSKATQHRKLSISVQLSAPGDYVGGALRFWSMNDSQEAPKDQGSMVLFPPYLMHVAKPVWWGRREVLVGWMDGTALLT